MNGPMIHARGLVKRFGDLVAVDGIDLDVQRGRGLRLPRPERRRQELDDADDRLRLAGHRAARSASSVSIRRPTGRRSAARLGVVPQQDTLDTELTVRENVLIYGRYFGLSRRELRPKIDELLDFVQLSERAGDKVEPLSGGMKRRLTIARSLVNDPELLLLDEPTTGLDPQARHVVWDRLFRLKQRGVTLVLTTHYMDEAEQLCDRLVVMDHGRIVAEGSPRQLIEQYSTREVVEVRFEDERPQNGALARRRRPGRGAPRPHAHLHGRRRRDRDRDRRARPAAALDADPAEHARGRLPAPDRPHARRLMDGHRSSRSARTSTGSPSTSASGAARSGRASSTRCSTWPRSASGSARSSTSSRNAPAGVPYLDFIAPGLLAAAAMQTAATESSWPVMGAIKWTRTYYAMTATPLTERDVLIGHQLFVITRVLTGERRLPARRRRVRRRRLLARPARDPGGGR